jgi:hypothetical protein
VESRPHDKINSYCAWRKLAIIEMFVKETVTIPENATHYHDIHFSQAVSENEQSVDNAIHLCSPDDGSKAFS